MIGLYAAFILFVLLSLAIDLGVLNRDARVISFRRAMLMASGWVALALIFNICVYFMYHWHWLGLGLAADATNILTGREAFHQFLTGYILEESLSMDNLFVIAMIFLYFRVPLEHQHRVLYWGILGAIVMRGIMIAVGTVLIYKFGWIIYVFGLMLILTAVKMLISREEDYDPEKNLLVRFARRWFPVTKELQGEAFFVRQEGKTFITPLLLVLLSVESADVIFALDSIPAVLAITTDPFLVFTSNIFAILGLRSLYFALAGIIDRFHYLKFSLVFVLGFVGAKMLASHFLKISTLISLLVIAVILGAGILISVLHKHPHTKPQ
ncbi:MAG: TerC family protein [Candidatus Sumerlaeota bacterium]|nr:TerC family protein [Candidatus Sumerlaeota bacterium]